MDHTQMVGVVLIIGSATVGFLALEGIFIYLHMAYPISSGARGEEQVKRIHAMGRRLQARAKRFWPIAAVVFVLGVALLVFG